MAAMGERTDDAVRDVMKFATLVLLVIALAILFSVIV